MVEEGLQGLEAAVEVAVDEVEAFNMAAQSAEEAQVRQLQGDQQVTLGGVWLRTGTHKLAFLPNVASWAWCPLPGSGNIMFWRLLPGLSGDKVVHSRKNDSPT